MTSEIVDGEARRGKCAPLPEIDIVSAIRSHAGSWCYLEEGKDGQDWTCGSFLPERAADEVDRMRERYRLLARAYCRATGVDPRETISDAGHEAWELAAHEAILREAEHV